MKHKNLLIVLLSILIIPGILFGCAPKSDPSSTATSSTISVTPDPFGKYSPAIEVGWAKEIAPEFQLRDGDTWEKNIWTDEYLNTLGIKIAYDWTVVGSDDDYAQKLNLTMASGVLPDCFWANPNQLSELVETDQIEDLTTYYDQYGSEHTKTLMTDDGGIAIKSATFGGKLFGIPHMGGFQGFAKLIYVRKDWLDKLKLPEPKTFNDFLTIATAFTTKDPDGNGIKDTYGMALGIPDPGYGDLKGFFNSFHAYIGDWITDPTSGKLVWGSIQPEVKDGLAVLADMYKDGLIDKEFITKDGGKIAEDIVAGKIGLFYGSDWNPYYPIVDSMKADTSANWIPYPVPSVDSTPAKVHTGFPIFRYYVVRKGYEHPEALVKMMNLFIEKTDGSVEDYNKYGTDPDDSYLYTRLSPVFAQGPNYVKAYLDIKEAFETGDTSKLRHYIGSRYQIMKEYNETKDINKWAVTFQQGPKDSSYGILNYYVENNLMIPPQYYGAPTPSFIANKGTLEQLQNTTFAKIITGEAPISEFDKFVTSWKSLGGDAMTKEANDVVDSMK